MTTATLDKPIYGIGERNQSSLQRIWNTTKLQYTDRQWLIWTPLVILGGAFLITLAIVLIVMGATGWQQPTEFIDGMEYSWAILAPIWYMPTAAIMAINPTIHLAFAYSLARREFYLGTVFAYVLAALFQATVVTVWWFIEKGTFGYGLGIRFVDSAVYTDATWYNVFLIAALLYFSIMGISTFIVVMYLRWKVWGVLLTIATIIVLILGTAVIITTLQAWPEFMNWVAGQTELFFAWVAGVALFSLILGYLFSRRITPQN